MDGEVTLLNFNQYNTVQTISSERYNFSAQLGVCVNGKFGAYCRNGLNDSELAVACQTITDLIQFPDSAVFTGKA